MAESVSFWKSREVMLARNVVHLGIGALLAIIGLTGTFTDGELTWREWDLEDEVCENVFRMAALVGVAMVITSDPAARLIGAVTDRVVGVAKATFGSKKEEEDKA